MGEPPRRMGIDSGTAALVAAVSLLLVGARCVGAPADGEKPPISLQVWRYHFPGEMQYLASLQGAYQRQTGRLVELYEGDWQESSLRIDDWTGRRREYAPDMMVVSEADLSRVLSQAVPLDTHFGRAFLESFQPGVLAQGRVQGVLVALPWMASPRALYYNADWLAGKGLSPPQTPEQLLEVAAKAADPPAVYGFGLPASSDGDAADFFLTLFRAQGGVLFDEHGRLAIGEDPGLRTLSLLAGLVQGHATQPETLTWQAGELERLFLEGHLAMLIEGPWLLREATLHPPPFKLGVAPVPRVEGATEKLTTDCVMVFDTARDLDGCTQFLEYVLGVENQQFLASLGVLPVRKDAGGSLPKGEGWEVFRRALRDGRGPSSATWGQIAPLVEQMMYVTLSGRATAQESLDAIDVDLVGDPEYERLGLKPERRGP